MSNDRVQQSRQRTDANRCFVCGPGNARGLQVQFELVGDRCVAEFTPGPGEAGYDQVTHGGILFSLADDVMANWIWLRGEHCFTARADIRYRQPLPLGIPIQVRGWCQKRKGRLALMESEIVRLDTDETVVQATGSFMITGVASEKT